VVFFGIVVFQKGRTSALNTPQLISAIVTGVLVLGSVVSGGLSSIGTMPRALSRVHQVALSLATLSTAVALYLLLQANQ
jgi:hypothetical protein